jgi:hypothetical protein
MSYAVRWVAEDHGLVERRERNDEDYESDAYRQNKCVLCEITDNGNHHTGQADGNRQQQKHAMQLSLQARLHLLP